MNTGLTIAFISSANKHPTIENYHKFGNKYWNDTQNNNSKIGYYFAYYYQQKYVFIHKIINILPPNERPSEMAWVSDRQILCLGPQLKMFTWYQWIHGIGFGAPYTPNYRMTQTCSYTNITLLTHAKYKNFNFINFINFINIHEQNAQSHTSPIITQSTTIDSTITDSTITNSSTFQSPTISCSDNPFDPASYIQGIVTEYSAVHVSPLLNDDDEEDEEIIKIERKRKRKSDARMEALKRIQAQEDEEYRIRLQEIRNKKRLKKITEMRSNRCKELLGDRNVIKEQIDSLIANMARIDSEIEAVNAGTYDLETLSAN
jgi:hypothetical protein